MRKISTKERISLIIALIFFFTTLTVNIKTLKRYKIYSIY